MDLRGKLTEEDRRLPDGLRQAQARARVVPQWITLVLLAGALGLTAHWMVTETGLAGLLMRAQAAVFQGKYYVLVTGLLTLLATLIPVIVAVQLLAAWLIGRKKDA